MTKRNAKLNLTSKVARATVFALLFVLVLGICLVTAFDVDLGGSDVAYASKNDNVSSSTYGSISSVNSNNQITLNDIGNDFAYSWYTYTSFGWGAGLTGNDSKDGKVSIELTCDGSNNYSNLTYSKRYNFSSTVLSYVQQGYFVSVSISASTSGGEGQDYGIKAITTTSGTYNSVQSTQGHIDVSAAGINTAKTATLSTSTTGIEIEFAGADKNDPTFVFQNVVLTFNYAQYTVAYNANVPAGVSLSATGTTSNSTHTIFTAKNLTKNGYSLVGYKFLGWTKTQYTTAQSSLPSGGYTDQQSVTNLTTTNGATVTLYAVWQPLFGLIYHENGDNDDTTSVTVEQGTSITLLTASGLPSNFTKAGHYFAGWAGSASSKTNIGSSITAGANGTQRHIYAIWLPISYTITFNKNDSSASGSMSNMIGTYSGAVTLTANAFTKQDSFFKNWYLSTSSATLADKATIAASTFAGYLTAAQSSIDTSSVTLSLTAQWTTETFEFGKSAKGTGKWGSANNPYIIRTTTHWNNLATIINNNCPTSGSNVVGSIVGSSLASYSNPIATANSGYYGATFLIENNLTFSGTYTTVGNVNYQFKGSFVLS